MEKVSLTRPLNPYQSLGAKADPLRLKRNPQAKEFRLKRLKKTFAQQKTGQN